MVEAMKKITHYFFITHLLPTFYLGFLLLTNNFATSLKHIHEEMASQQKYTLTLALGN